MGNHPSAESKPEAPASSSQGPSPASGVPVPSQHNRQQQAAHGESYSPRHSRRDTRNILHHSTHHRSAAPPEASLAQAQGSTVVSRPKSMPGTAVSSLSGSPHSNASLGGAGGHSAGASGSVPRHDRPEKQPAPPDEPSKPVDVPREQSAQFYPHAHYNSDTAAANSDQNLMSTGSVTDMYLTHPPRLPLPIEEEVHTPGSPILAPQESGLPVPTELGGGSSEGLARKGSGLSAGTAGTAEDDEEDSEELQVDKARPVVPTRIVWRRGGEKVYVTGSIFQWSRKHRLHPVDGRPGYFSATIPVLPGTHHVRFLVDGIMQTSPDLPMTVDFGNNLVNYIEVSPDEAHKHRHRHTPTSSRPDSAEPSGTDSRTSRTSSVSKDEKSKPPARLRPVPPPESYRREIPQYLQDFDQAEDSPAYQAAAAAIEKLPTPPSLPGFLSKPILNAAVLMKDDNSVLNLPNHTVLNHLATSSIKNGVLAVSATTRYKSKYITTIIYKPTSADEG